MEPTQTPPFQDLGSYVDIKAFEKEFKASTGRKLSQADAAAIKSIIIRRGKDGRFHCEKKWGLYTTSARVFRWVFRVNEDYGMGGEEKPLKGLVTSLLSSISEGRDVEKLQDFAKILARALTEQLGEETIQEIKVLQEKVFSQQIMSTLKEIRRDAQAFKNISEELKSTPEFMSELIGRLTIKERGLIQDLIKQDARVFQYVSNEVRKKIPGFLLAAACWNGLILQYVNEAALEFTEDEEEAGGFDTIILAAIRNNEEVIKLFPERSQNRAFLLKALEKNAKVFPYIPDNFQQSRRFIRQALNLNIEVLSHVPEHMQRNKRLLLEVVKESPRLVQYMVDDLKEDKAFVLDIVKANGLALRYLDNWKNDKEVACAAVQENAWAFAAIDEKLQKNEEVRQAALKKDPEVQILIDRTL